VLCNKEKCNKVSCDLLKSIFSADLTRISSDGKEWVCKTCDRALARGSMPLQAEANGLQLSEIPPELSGLNALPSGKQRSIHWSSSECPIKG